MPCRLQCHVLQKVRLQPLTTLTLIRPGRRVSQNIDGMSCSDSLPPIDEAGNWVFGPVCYGEPPHFARICRVIVSPYSDTKKQR